MLDLWLKILDIMDRLMNSGQGDHLEEAVPESLKNILLVMADGGFITPPSNHQPPTELWEQTRKRVDRFLPGLVAEIFPQITAPESASQASPANQDVPEQLAKARRSPVEQPLEEETNAEKQGVTR